MRMRNCFILGSGRSGTSLLAGSLRDAGYYMGERLIPPSEDNPKGFYEDREINSINEALLAEVTAGTPNADSTDDDTIRWGWRWLAEVPLRTRIPCSDALTARIRDQLSRAPFCFKDPRFCYTLPVWRQYLPDTVFVCVFREPSRTAESIVKTCERGVYLHGLKLTFDKAIELWSLMYRHILQIHRREGEWLFLHYDQILSGRAIPRLEKFLEAPVDCRFADRTLKRSTDRGNPGASAKSVYDSLCELAHFA